MSVRTMARVWADSKHSGTELLMMLAIADFSDDDGNAYPAVQTLAEKCRMGTRNANLILATLRASGELEVLMNQGPRGTNKYRITLVEGMKSASPLKNTSPLKAASSTPVAGFPKPLKPATDEPSLNHQEPSERERSAKKQRIPHDWKPDGELTEWAHEKRPDLDVGKVVEEFRDYWIAQGTARASWDASFRTWVRREKQQAGKRHGLHAGFQSMDYREGIAADGSFL